MYKISAAETVVYKLTLYTLLISIIVVSGCTTAKQVTRIDPDTTIDLSGRWNDTDSRFVAEEMIGDCLTHPWINNHGTATGDKPVVIVGNIQNNKKATFLQGGFCKVGLFEGTSQNFLLTQGNSQCPQYPLTPRVCRYIPIRPQWI